MRFLLQLCTATLIICVLIQDFAADNKVFAGDKNEKWPAHKMSAEDKELFSSLTDAQKNNLREGKIEVGYNEWMVKIAKGEPYYKTTNTPVGAQKVEVVWLYTKKETTREEKENKTIDPKTGVLSYHRMLTEMICDIGDVFIIFDRGVVKQILPDNSHKRYGKCEINTTDTYLPL